MSINNQQERIRKMQPSKQRWGLRKLSIGVTSVLLGLTFMGANASADSNSTAPVSTDNQSNISISKTNATINTSDDNSQIVLQGTSQSPASDSTSNSSAQQAATSNSAQSQASAASDQMSLNTNNFSANAGNTSWTSQALSQNLQETSNDETTASVTNAQQFVDALLNTKINTIKVDNNIVFDGSIASYRRGHESITNADYTGIGILIGGRNLVIDGQNRYSIDFRDKFFSFGWVNGAWDITLKNIKITQENSSNEWPPFYFGEGNRGIAAKNHQFTYENVTEDVTGATIFDSRYGKATVHFKGTNNLTDRNINSVKQNWYNTNAIQAQEVDIADNAVVNLHIIGINSPQNRQNPLMNNAILISQGDLNLGRNAQLNIDGGDKETPLPTDYRGIILAYDHDDHGTVAVPKSAKVNIGEGAQLNLNMGGGHSTAILAESMNIDKDATVTIQTAQDNDGSTTNTAADDSQNTKKWDKIDYKGDDYSNGYTLSPITLGPRGTNSNLTVNGTLIVHRTNTSSVNDALISFAQNGGGGSANYTMTVGDGATLQLTDNANTTRGVIAMYGSGQHVINFDAGAADIDLEKTYGGNSGKIIDSGTNQHVNVTDNDQHVAHVQYWKPTSSQLSETTPADYSWDVKSINNNTATLAPGYYATSDQSTALQNFNQNFSWTNAKRIHIVSEPTENESIQSDDIYETENKIWGKIELPSFERLQHRLTIYEGNTILGQYTFIPGIASSNGGFYYFADGRFVAPFLNSQTAKLGTITLKVQSWDSATGTWSTSINSKDFTVKNSPVAQSDNNQPNSATNPRDLSSLPTNPQDLLDITNWTDKPTTDITYHYVAGLHDTTIVTPTYSQGPKTFYVEVVFNDPNTDIKNAAGNVYVHQLVIPVYVNHKKTEAENAVLKETPKGIIEEGVNDYALLHQIDQSNPSLYDLFKPAQFVASEHANPSKVEYTTETADWLKSIRNTNTKPGVYEIHLVVTYDDGSTKTFTSHLIIGQKPQGVIVYANRNVLPDIGKYVEDWIPNLHPANSKEYKPYYPTSVNHKWETSPDVTKVTDNDHESTGYVTIHYTYNGRTILDWPTSIKVRVVDPQGSSKYIWKGDTLPGGGEFITNTGEGYEFNNWAPDGTQFSYHWNDGTNINQIVGKHTGSIDIQYAKDIKDVPAYHKNPDGTEYPALDTITGKQTFLRLDSRGLVDSTLDDTLYVMDPPTAGSLQTNVGVIPDLSNSTILKQAITNADPTSPYEPHSASWKTLPDVSKVGTTSGVVTVTYTDPTDLTKTITKDVTVPVTVIIKDADKYALEGKTQYIWSDGSPSIYSDASWIKWANGAAPTGVSYTTPKWSTDSQGHYEVRTQTSQVTVTFADGSTKTVNVTLGVRALPTAIPQVSDVSTPLTPNKDNVAGIISNLKSGNNTTLYPIGLVANTGWITSGPDENHEQMTAPDFTKVGKTFGWIDVDYGNGVHHYLKVPITVGDKAHGIVAISPKALLYIDNPVLHKTSDSNAISTIDPTTGNPTRLIKQIIFYSNNDDTVGTTYTYNSDTNLFEHKNDNGSMSSRFSGSDFTTAWEKKPNTVVDNNTPNGTGTLLHNDANYGNSGGTISIKVNTSSAANLLGVKAGYTINGVAIQPDFYGSTSNGQLYFDPQGNLLTKQADGTYVKTGKTATSLGTADLQNMLTNSTYETLSQKFSGLSLSWQTTDGYTKGDNKKGFIRISFTDGTYLDVPVTYSVVDIAAENYTLTGNTQDMWSDGSLPTDSSWINWADASGNSTTAPEGVTYTPSFTGLTKDSQGHYNAGKYNGQVTVTFKDGSRKTVVVTLNVREVPTAKEQTTDVSLEPLKPSAGMISNLHSTNTSTLYPVGLVPDSTGNAVWISSGTDEYGQTMTAPDFKNPGRTFGWIEVNYGNGIHHYLKVPITVSDNGHGIISDGQSALIYTNNPAWHKTSGTENPTGKGTFGPTGLIKQITVYHGDNDTVGTTYTYDSSNNTFTANNGDSFSADQLTPSWWQGPITTTSQLPGNTTGTLLHTDNSYGRNIQLLNRLTITVHGKAATVLGLKDGATIQSVAVQPDYYGAIASDTPFNVTKDGHRIITAYSYGSDGKIDYSKPTYLDGGSLDSITTAAQLSDYLSQFINDADLQQHFRGKYTFSLVPTSDNESVADMISTLKAQISNAADKVYIRINFNDGDGVTTYLDIPVKVKIKSVSGGEHTYNDAVSLEFDVANPNWHRVDYQTPFSTDGTIYDPVNLITGFRITHLTREGNEPITTPIVEYYQKQADGSFVGKDWQGNTHTITLEQLKQSLTFKWGTSGTSEPDDVATASGNHTQTITGQDLNLQIGVVGDDLIQLMDGVTGITYVTTIQPNLYGAEASGRTLTVNRDGNLVMKLTRPDGTPFYARTDVKIDNPTSYGDKTLNGFLKQYVNTNYLNNQKASFTLSWKDPDLLDKLSQSGTASNVTANVLITFQDGNGQTSTLTVPITLNIVNTNDFAQIVRYDIIYYDIQSQTWHKVNDGSKNPYANLGMKDLVQSFTHYYMLNQDGVASDPYRDGEFKLDANGNYSGDSYERWAKDSAGINRPVAPNYSEVTAHKSYSPDEFDFKWTAGPDADFGSNTKTEHAGDLTPDEKNKNKLTIKPKTGSGAAHDLGQPSQPYTLPVDFMGAISKGAVTVDKSGHIFSNGRFDNNDLSHGTTPATLVDHSDLDNSFGTKTYTIDDWDNVLTQLKNSKSGQTVTAKVRITFGDGSWLDVPVTLQVTTDAEHYHFDDANIWIWNDDGTWQDFKKQTHPTTGKLTDEAILRAYGRSMAKQKMSPYVRKNTKIDLGTLPTTVGYTPQATRTITFADGSTSMVKIGILVIERPKFNQIVLDSEAALDAKTLGVDTSTDVGKANNVTVSEVPTTPGRHRIKVELTYNLPAGMDPAFQRTAETHDFFIWILREDKPTDISTPGEYRPRYKFTYDKTTGDLVEVDYLDTQSGNTTEVHKISYDKNHQITKIEQYASDGKTLVATFTRDKSGQLVNGAGNPYAQKDSADGRAKVLPQEAAKAASMTQDQLKKLVNVDALAATNNLTLKWAENGQPTVSDGHLQGMLLAQLSPTSFFEIPVDALVEEDPTTPNHGDSATTGDDHQNTGDGHQTSGNVDHNDHQNTGSDTGSHDDTGNHNDSGKHNTDPSDGHQTTDNDHQSTGDDQQTTGSETDHDDSGNQNTDPTDDHKTGGDNHQNTGDGHQASGDVDHNDHQNTGSKTDDHDNSGNHNTDPGDGHQTSDNDHQSTGDDQQTTGSETGDHDGTGNQSTDPTGDHKTSGNDHQTSGNNVDHNDHQNTGPETGSHDDTGDHNDSGNHNTDPNDDHQSTGDDHQTTGSETGGHGDSGNHNNDSRDDHKIGGDDHQSTDDDHQTAGSETGDHDDTGNHNTDPSDGHQNAGDNHQTSGDLDHNDHQNSETGDHDGSGNQSTDQSHDHQDSDNDHQSTSSETDEQAGIDEDVHDDQQPSTDISLINAADDNNDQTVHSGEDAMSSNSQAQLTASGHQDVLTEESSQRRLPQTGQRSNRGLVALGLSEILASLGLAIGNKKRKKD